MAKGQTLLTPSGSSVAENPLAFVAGYIARGIRQGSQAFADPEMTVTSNWILANGFLNEKGRSFEFDRHEFLRDPVDDWSRFLVVKKASQVGFTCMQFLKCVHGCTNPERRYTFLYSLPTEVRVRQLIVPKIDPILKINEALRKMGGRSAEDSAMRKRFDLGWIFFRGTEGEAQDISDTVDCIINDELDFSRQKTIEGFDSRVTASDFKGRWEFSHPTADDYGISKRFDASDQKHWFHRCSRCGKHSFLKWPDSVDLERRCYICGVCGEPLREEDRMHGQWVAKYPSRAGRGGSGYWISHMIAPWISCEDVIRAYEEKSDWFFRTYVIAEADPKAHNKIKRDYVLNNCHPEAEPDTAVKIMVVDQRGAEKHIGIGDIRGLYFLDVVPDWPDVDRAFEKHQPNICICDQLPDSDKAKDFAEAHRGRVYLNLSGRQSEHLRTEAFWFDEKNMVLLTDRHKLISSYLSALLAKTAWFYMGKDDRMLAGISPDDKNCFAGHCESLTRKRVEVDGTVKHLWVAEGNQGDHFAMVGAYWLAGRERMRKTDKSYGQKDIHESPASSEDDSDLNWYG